MANQGICPTCPFDAAINAAEQLVGTYETVHKDAERALGGISITRTCLEAVANKVECPKPVVNNNGQLDCPLRENTYTSRSMVTSPWPEGNWMVQLSKIGARPSSANSPTTGQYL